MWAQISDAATKSWQALSNAVMHEGIYWETAAIVAAVLGSWVFATYLKRSTLFEAPPEQVAMRRARVGLYRLSFTLFPLVLAFVLAMLVRLLESGSEKLWLLRVSESIALVYLLYSLISKFIDPGFVRTVSQWYGLPVATLAAFGWLDEVKAFLESKPIELGGLSLNVYDVASTIVFGTILFWFGRVSNTRGKAVIRRQEQLDRGTREVFAKLFEISVFVVVFLLLLNLLGINLTALAVFGGALGVGLGFGLQQIASNFISGIIILLDRSLAIGDHVELEDGRSGTLRELNMRFGVIETYDGKDVVVPNEQFITTSYTNWTHKDPRQRYSLEFQVAYSTDLDALFSDLRILVADHPQVLSDPELPPEFLPDAEIAGFGDSGIDVLIEYWIEAIDDGANRVGADLYLSIYHLFKDKGYEFPFPQREVRVLSNGTPLPEPAV